ncbi:TonB-dependent receptor [Duganella zoogloeoides]|uniref:TonB-dependent receptor n=1 Tax=Duganella zoogloeoides TaxID=75659 RepID=A0ABZ0XUT1_9BURK|nr:TonB-dependent receptor [Duganella zoogloeoides]WQH03508.1 TonB-dependent receptor [Duganella zoogloeoides]
MQVVAHAQEAAPEALQKVEVTGSRIPTLNTESISPMVSLGSKDIKLDGVRNVESLLNNLPQVFAAQSGNVVNGASGTATVDLRGLGENRTLVLVDGRRLPAGSPGSTAADLNQIPAALIKRVDVMSGGAGAVYGADAVSGVVNFIMIDNFEGVQVELNGSGYNHQQNNPHGVGDVVAGRSVGNPTQFQRPGNKSFDGRSKDASLLIGGNFAEGKGNATVFFSYKKDDALLQSERDFTSCALTASAAGYGCGGSGTNATGRFVNTKTNAIYTATANGDPRAYTANDAYNYGPINHLQRPSERYGVSASARFDVNDKIRVYSNFAFHDNTTDAQIAPGGIFGNIYTLRYDNPMLSPAMKNAFSLFAPGDETDVVVQRRNVEGGGRVALFNNTSYRMMFGAKGTVGKWNYDVYAQTSKVRYAGSSENYFSKERGAKALDVVNVNGVATCRSVVDGSDPNCVPYNPWTLGAVTPEQLAYIQTPGQTYGHTAQQIQSGTLAADLGDYGIKVPGAKSGVGVSFGVERRVESLELNPDAPSANFDLDGAGGPVVPVKGRYVVKDIFGEVQIPLLEDRSFAKLLSTNLSFRHTDLSTGVTANTYGAGLMWQPSSMLSVRASHQKAVRAPNINELYSPAGNNLFNADADPCAGATPTATFAECARTGVTAAQYGNIQDSPAGQYNYLAGGNSNLKPETAKSNTFGLVIAPMRNLTVTLDYFDIKIKDTISNVNPLTTLDKCLESGNSLYCSQITRDRLGTLWLLPEASIVGTNVNIGSMRTSGVDVGASYDFRATDYGRFSLMLNGSLLTKFEVEELPGEPAYDCVGKYNGDGNCDQPRPKWRHKLRLNWGSPFKADVALTWRYFKAVDLEDGATSLVASDRRLPATSYFDLAASYPVTKQISVMAGINNLFDKDPPITSKYGVGQGNGNTFPSTYDALGRKLFMNLTARF